MDLQRLRFVRRHYRTRTKAARAAAPMKTSPVRSGRGGHSIRPRAHWSTMGAPATAPPTGVALRVATAKVREHPRSVGYFLTSNYQ
jgi:hypothetical protein